MLLAAVQAAEFLPAVVFVIRLLLPVISNLRYVLH